MTRLKWLILEEIPLLVAALCLGAIFFFGIGWRQGVMLFFIVFAAMQPAVLIPFFRKRSRRKND